ncbi:MAG: hypothetical protein JNL79_23255 [Myxococcales bacterium]|nr:hypothetical protein [Myxococcales bacterium]
MARRFDVVALGDALLQTIELKTGGAECRLVFDFGRLITDPTASIFDAPVYCPACLVFSGVRSLAFDLSSYQLNSTVVGHGATQRGAEVEFYLDLTGGWDNDHFMVRLTIVAEDFEYSQLGPGGQR